MTLNVRNGLDQAVNVTFSELTSFKVTDVIINGGSLLAGAGEIRTAAASIGEIVNVVNTIEEFWSFLAAIRRIATIYENSTKPGVDKLKTAISNLWELFSSTTLSIKPGDTVDILNRSTLDSYFNAAFVGKLLQIPSLTINIYTADKSQGVTIESTTFTSWEIRDDGVHNLSDNSTYRWDGQASCRGSPSVTTWDQGHLIAWRSNHDNMIYVMGGQDWYWTPPVKLPSNKTVINCSVTASGKKICVGYVDTDGAANVLISVDLGASWQGPFRIGSSSNVWACQVAKVWNGNLLAVLQYGDDSIYVSSCQSLDTLDKWSEPAIHQGIASNSAPGVALWSSRAWIGFTGSGLDTGLYYVSYDSQNWVAPQAMPGTGAGGVGMAAYQDKLYAAWSNIGGGNAQFWMNSFDGNVWGTPQPIGSINEPYSVPQLVPSQDGSKLYMAWGEHSSGAMWFQSYDGTSWSERNPVLAFI